MIKLREQAKLFVAGQEMPGLFVGGAKVWGKAVPAGNPNHHTYLFQGTPGSLPAGWTPYWYGGNSSQRASIAPSGDRLRFPPAGSYFRAGLLWTGLGPVTGAVRVLTRVAMNFPSAAISGPVVNASSVDATDKRTSYYWWMRTTPTLGRAFNGTDTPFHASATRLADQLQTLDVELYHDGNGRVEGRAWTAGQPRPADPMFSGGTSANRLPDGLVGVMDTSGPGATPTLFHHITVATDGSLIP